MMRALSLLACSLAVAGTACAPRAGEAPPESAPLRTNRDPLAYLRSTLAPWPDASARGRLAITDPASGRVATYDSALVALVLIRRGERDEAARVLEALRALQRPDGSLPFSFILPRADGGVVYVRSGAVAWVGYAAAEYLDADSKGPARDVALALARGAAAYLLDRQIATSGDPRNGLVRGGEGVLRYEVDAHGVVRERLDPGEVAWASSEHNVDAFFFLRALARVTGEARYAEASARVAEGLLRGWSGARGQLARGVSEAGPDDVQALDCASWGSLFLRAAGERDRADTAASVADAGYASRDPRTGARGHRAQARGPLLEAELLMRHLAGKLPARDWADLEAVWPEGSAGVALAALRAGRVARARAILDDLDALRGPDGSLPTSTVDVPFMFDTRPSVAGTAWTELVRFELGRAPDRPTFWVP